MLTAVLHPLVALAGLPALAPDPSDIPDSEIPAELVTPGVWGFAATAGIAIITILLIVDMTRRVRRARYRGEVAEQLEAERVAAEAARADPDRPQA